MKMVRISCMAVGLSMLLQWSYFIISGNVPEFDTTPVSISFHIFIELVTALLLLLAAFAYRRKDSPARYLVIYTQGMLGYTVINSAGYFAQSGQWFFLAMFFVLLLVSVNNTRIIMKTGS